MKEHGSMLWALGFKNYKEYLMSDMWQQKREGILGFYPECQKCRKNKSEEVHHLTYENIGNEKLHELQVLCKECHKEAHKK